ncbi:hypothetical protein ILYODFUR_030281 [Ilyodon furcidens]|uniref:Fibrinogen C-terminal domain-containing protein n=1 Tax=Ilyodon furcidens TaxID=33524 RepID=A0ABV0TPX0_9TELE
MKLSSILFLLAPLLISGKEVKLPVDCNDIYNNDNKQPSGVYIIYPSGGTSAIQVYCDMDSEGGRWTNWDAGAADSVETPRLPSPQTPPLAPPGRAQGIPRPAERHSPSSVSWAVPWASSGSRDATLSSTGVNHNMRQLSWGAISKPTPALCLSPVGYSRVEEGSASLDKMGSRAHTLVGPLGDGLVSLVRAWPGHVPRGETQPLGALRRVSTPGLAPWWDLGSAILGGVTCLDFVVLMKAS